MQSRPLMLFIGIVTVGCLNLLDACLASPGTIKASPQGGSFRLIPAQGTLVPVSGVHSVFFSSDLVVQLLGQPKTIAIACTLWESLYNPDQKEDSKGLLMPDIGS